MEQITRAQLRLTGTHQNTLHTTIALQKVTKVRLDGSKAPGQCYDGFINELVEYWERYRIGISLCGPGRPIRLDAER
jgi:hypothetical protein